MFVMVVMVVVLVGGFKGVIVFVRVVIGVVIITIISILIDHFSLL